MDNFLQTISLEEAISLIEQQQQNKTFKNRMYQKLKLVWILLIIIYQYYQQHI
jgi:hypothetical protein